MSRLWDMGNSQPSEGVTVSAEGITVIKRFEEDEFPVPAIAFEFRSERAEPVTVRLHDAVPEGVAVEDLGFHPEYGSEYWTVEDGGISFEREFDPDAEYTTVYGIRATGTEDIEQFLTEPTVAEVDPPLSDSAGAASEEDDVAEVDVVPGDDEALKDAIAGDGTVPGLGDEDAEGEAADTLDLDDPTGNEGVEATEGTDPSGTAEAEGAQEPGDTETADAEDTEPEEPEDTGTEEPGETGTAAEADADEPPVDAETVVETEPEAEPEESVSDGRPEDGTEPDEDGQQADGTVSAASAVDGSLLAALAREARENDLPDEDAATLREALGVSDQPDGSVEARVQRIQRDVADLRAYTDALEEFLDENGTGRQILEEAREGIDQFEDRLDEFERTVERVETNVDETDAATQELRSDVGEVRGEVEETAASVEDLEAEVATVGEDLDEVRAQVPEGDLTERIEEMESDLQELREWQTQIKETFGG